MSSRSIMSSSPGRVAIAASLLAAAALAMPAPAMADRGGHRGHGYGHGHGGGHHWNGGPRIGVYVPAPVYRPHFYAPPAVYYAPRVIYPAPQVVYVPPLVHSPRVYAPPVYVERNDVAAIPSEQTPAPAADTAVWFFCADSNTYYPYVRECASPWQRVPAQPSTAPR